MLALAAGCVPEGPPTKGAKGRGATTPPARSVVPAQRTSTPRTVDSAAPPSPPLSGPFEDRFDRERLGPDLRALSPVWQVVDGELCGQGAKNRGVWLRRALPVDARIEFDARSESPDGDIKAEYWGDGRSGATAVSYTDATSYLTILGGWKNSRHVLARIDEHAPDRLALQVDRQSPDRRAWPVEPGQTYRFRVERSDGNTLSWWVDDELYFELADTEPLSGQGHDHFGFNNWTVPVCFDNLKITPL
ncbi:MAG: hypothetical protein JRI23_07095 [Deltaproteobacteria bacterium]|nr:hypothetical protein [Deltaproteobacteria bacterium]MBW2531358.1 hypothetical protein [Deltaproteobacteria bacterium]